MIVCIDTNVVLGMFAAGHPHRAIYEAWAGGKLTWAVSSEILLEYEEIMQQRSGKARADKMMQLIEVVGHLRGNMKRVGRTFRFEIIRDDPDDNKFVDTAIVAEARYIITNDRHFAILAGKSGRPGAITPEEFFREVLAEL